MENNSHFYAQAGLGASIVFRILVVSFTGTLSSLSMFRCCISHLSFVKILALYPILWWGTKNGIYALSLTSD